MSQPQSILIKMTLGNDIRWRYVLMVQEHPLALRSPWFYPEQLETASRIKIERREGDVRIEQEIKFVRQEGVLFYFEAVGEPLATAQDRILTLNYHTPLRLCCIEKTQLPDYRQLVHQENSTYQNSMSRKLRKMLPSDGTENRNLMKYMIELDNKLDDIMDMLQKKEERAGCLEVQALALSANCFVLHSDTDIPEGQLAYTNNKIGYGEDRFSFATLVSVHRLEQADTGWFYQANFLDTREEITDNIVNFLFSREREMIKEVKEI